MTSSPARISISFPAFYLIWAEINGWDVPDFQVEVCDFLQDYGEEGLLMIPRGHGKSTFLDVYNAWEITRDQDVMILHQGATDSDAYKVSRGTEQVLARHPVCKAYGINKARGETQKWWVSGAADVRHGTIHARGILSNVTGARASLIQNDDVEVPANIGTAEAREKLRYRLSEQTHILLPTGRVLWVGTPHTHESLYTDVRNRGAKCFVRRAFAEEFRAEDAAARSPLVCPFRPEFVFSGIGDFSKALEFSAEKLADGRWQVSFAGDHHLIDCYAGALWPERFTPKVMERRRKKCRTLNEWDSQYQLHAKPVGEMRLNPDRLQAYDCEPVLQTANGHLVMRLGDVRIVSAALRWDPSSGKTGSDVSGLCLLLQDEHGRYYWHRSMGLQGAIAEFDAHDRICGGQVWAVCDMVEQFHIGRVVIETNGIGGHNPSILRAALKARRLQCGITEHHATGNKQKRILQALEGPLSSGLIWAHLSVLETAEGTDAAPVRELREFNPLATNQHDDHIDALAGAISDGPALIGKSSKKQDAHTRKDWRAVGGTHEVALDFSGG